MNKHILHILESPTSAIVVDAASEFVGWITQWRHQRRATDPIHWISAIHNQEKTSITIKQIREIGASLSYSIRSDEGRDVILLNTELCSLPAQHALLKMVEEPPERIKFWLVTSSPSQLLETIQSRCNRVTIEQILNKDAAIENATNSPIINAILTTLNQNSPGGVLSAMQQVGTDRDTAKQAVQDLLKTIRDASGAESATDPQNISQQHACIEALEWLDANAHVGLTLDHLAITLWSTKKLGKE